MYDVGSVPGNKVILMRWACVIASYRSKVSFGCLGERREMKERPWRKVSQGDIVVINRGLVLLLN